MIRSRPRRTNTALTGTASSNTQSYLPSSYNDLLADGEGPAKWDDSIRSSDEDSGSRTSSATDKSKRRRQSCHLWWYLKLRSYLIIKWQQRKQHIYNQHQQQTRSFVFSRSIAILLAFTLVLLAAVSHSSLYYHDCNSALFQFTELLFSHNHAPSSPSIRVSIPRFNSRSVHQMEDIDNDDHAAGQIHMPKVMLLLPPLENQHHNNSDNSESSVDDIGGLIISPLRQKLHPNNSSSVFLRDIDPHDNDHYETYRQTILHHDATRGKNSYDTNGNSVSEDDDKDHMYKINDGDNCVEQNWKHDYKPNCNSVHEIPMARDSRDLHQMRNDQHSHDTDRLHHHHHHQNYDQFYDSYYIGHGYFRDAWVVESTHDNFQSVIKLNRYKFKATMTSFHVALRDALVMERLASSPRIVDIYGHCGNVVWVEAIPSEVKSLVLVPIIYDTVASEDNQTSHTTGATSAVTLAQDGEADAKDSKYGEATTIPPNDDGFVLPDNRLTATQKLQFALEMAESLADLHGFKDGLIVHDDVSLSQWLRLASGQLKLGDFNRAKIPDYNTKTNKYCLYKNGGGYGSNRAPEEFSNRPLSERLDLYSLGNNFYSLLTGVQVFYDEDDDEGTQKKLIGGATAFIDPSYESKSEGEKRLAEITRLCWEYDPKERIDVFEVVRLLRQAVRDNK